MQAVKMPAATQVKSQIRTTPADTSKGGDEFMKLLQVKKDQVQTDKTDVKPSSDSKDQKDTKDAKDVSKTEDKEERQDDGKDEKEVLIQDGGQDALIQAAMQQTAAQMSGIVTNEPERQLTETAKPENGTLAEEIPENQVIQPEAVTAAGEPVEAVKESVQQKESQTPDGETDKNTDDRFKALSGSVEKAPERETEVSSYKGQTEVKTQEKVQTEDKPAGHESLSGATAARTETEQGFEVQKTENVPLKTSQDTLPQDLGRMLSDKLPGAGRELVVELEPANLGKLTIKMVYEAGKAAVSIMATNPKTLEILNQKAGEIASILEEKTGQETIIYTESPKQENHEENPDGYQGRRGEQQGHEEKHQEKDDKHVDAESFAQQLRLGLV